MKKNIVLTLPIWKSIWVCIFLITSLIMFYIYKGNKTMTCYSFIFIVFTIIALMPAKNSSKGVRLVGLYYLLAFVIYVLDENASHLLSVDGVIKFPLLKYVLALCVVCIIGAITDEAPSEIDESDDELDELNRSKKSKSLKMKHFLKKEHLN